MCLRYTQSVKSCCRETFENFDNVAEKMFAVATASQNNMYETCVPGLMSDFGCDCDL